MKKDQPFTSEDPKRDVGGYLMDLARVATGLKGATEKVPEYETGKEFNQYMADATNRKDMGLMPQEKDYAQQ